MTRPTALDRAVAALARGIEILQHAEQTRAALEHPGYTWEPEIRPGDRERDIKRRRALYDENVRTARRGVSLLEKDVAKAQAAHDRRAKARASTA